MINKGIIQAARHFTGWDEGKAVFDAINNEICPWSKEPIFTAILCYASGVAEGKHQERQRQRLRKFEPAARAAGDCDFLLEVSSQAEPFFQKGDLAAIRRATLSPIHQRASAVVIHKDGLALMGRMIATEEGEYYLALPSRGLIPFGSTEFIGPVVAVWRSLEPITDENNKERCSA